MTEHGTASRYVNQKCRCKLCQTAWAQTQREQRERLAELPVPSHLHGRYSTYVNRSCRCEACRAAKNAYRREHRKATV
jgi:hypothetical protein